ncbi:MAG: TIGR02285 family protein [Proteobacteria bacterium]|nr:TIGR02285 family protein [Pseudomonadota bacterium]
MKRLLPALCAAWIVLAAAAPCPAHQDKNTVLWLYSDFPPFYITEGPYKGRGMADQVLELLISRLPEYRHERIAANTPRKMALFAQGENVASVALMRTSQREGFMTFSVPSLLAGSPRIVLLKKNRDRFPAGDPVSLESALGMPDLSLGMIRTRSYGTGPDRVLARHEGEKSLYCYQGTDSCPGLFRMLLSGRLDGFLACPGEARFLAVSQGVEDRVTTLALTEAEPYILGHVAAPDTPWGRKLIGRVNEILVQERPTPAYRAIMEQWLPPESREWLTRAYDEVFLAQNPGLEDAPAPEGQKAAEP